MNFCQKTIKIAQRLFGTEEYAASTAHQRLSQKSTFFVIFIQLLVN